MMKQKQCKNFVQQRRTAFLSLRFYTRRGFSTEQKDKGYNIQRKGKEKKCKNNKINDNEEGGK